MLKKRAKFLPLLTCFILFFNYSSVFCQEQSTIDYIKSFENKKKPIPPLPMGPENQNNFGAYYTKLAYYPEWDKDWRVGDYADVVVRFENAPYQFIFWRGTNYIPHWVTENNIWYNNEFTETWETVGSSEPMSDKQCRYSHVRILENNRARTVVHWRYALNDVSYRIAWPDSVSGWGDWCDEYYTLYPDGIGIRKIVLFSSYRSDDERHTDDEGHEWHEGIVVYHAYTTPEEAVNKDAVHVANMKGESGVWNWNTPGKPDTPTPKGSNIVLMNLKSQYKPFVVSPQPCEMYAYEGSQGGSRFRWRDHWPTTLEPTPGRNASGKQAAHGSYYHITKIPIYERSGDAITKILLHGMTEQTIKDVVPISKSWLNPPTLITKYGSKRSYYNRAERAYEIESSGGELSFTLKASAQSPIFNPVFIIRDWQGTGIDINADGARLEEGAAFRSDFVQRIDGKDLIIWMDLQTEKEVSIVLN
jgi:hypothetical protein